MNERHILLYWHHYPYFPYERKFAFKEAHTVLRPSELIDEGTHLVVRGNFTDKEISRLIYFSAAVDHGRTIQTLQAKFESHLMKNGNIKRQLTRYSVHGLHEYKGKFNPQVVRSIFNILGINEQSHIYDPFCGSGTTLVECAHIGMSAVGTDMNPLATYIANAKLRSLSTQCDLIKKIGNEIVRQYHLEILDTSDKIESNERTNYLARWFTQKNLNENV